MWLDRPTTFGATHLKLSLGNLQVKLINQIPQCDSEIDPNYAFGAVGHYSGLPFNFLKLYNLTPVESINRKKLKCYT